MYLKAISVQNITGNNRPRLSIRCPHCGNLANLAFFNDIDDLGIFNQEGHYRTGQRLCPNPECQGMIFYISRLSENPLLLIYPSTRIDFDKNNIPQNVLSVFEEAITCHAHGCYIAAGMMVRRTLEEICEERGAKGKNLVDRIKELGKNVILPPALFEGLDELRLFGNDAAHIEAKDYETIGKDETEFAIAITKEILKAIYQLQDLVSSMKKLRKDANSTLTSNP